MALQPIAKGIKITVRTERFTTKSRGEQSHFVFSAKMDSHYYKVERLAPGAVLNITAPGVNPVKALIIRTVTGKLSVATSLSAVPVVLDAAPALILTGVTLGAMVITNTDAVGSPSKDVVVEMYA